MTVESVKENALQRTVTEIATTAAASETAALVQARFIMALKQPRNMEQVRLDILAECSRPNFVAETEEGKGNSALYRRPVGGSKVAEGLGIRFVEMALQCMGNNMVDSFTVQESDTERVLRIFALDLQKNTSWSKTLTLAKTVERKNLKQGEVPIRTRLNSQQQMVYVLPSDEGSFATKEAAEVSKASRTLGLRLIPGDIQDQAITKILETRLKGVTDAPDAAMRRVVDGMALQKVSVIMLEEYLGQPIAQITPAQIVKLQGLYAALRDGETTWKEIMTAAEEERQQEQEAKTKPNKGVEATKEKIKQEEAKQAVTQTAATAAPQTSTPAPVVQQAQEVIEVCGSCGATNVPLADVGGVMLCEACKPKPAPQAPAVQEEVKPPQVQQPATQTEPTADAPPWIGKTEQEVKENTLPWQRPKPEATTQVPAATRPAGSLNLEDEVAKMAPPAKPRVKPLKPVMKGVLLPEFADRATQADAWSTELYQKAVSTIKTVPGSDSDSEGLLRETVKKNIGLPIEEINSSTLTALISILEIMAKSKA